MGDGGDHQFRVAGLHREAAAQAPEFRVERVEMGEQQISPKIARGGNQAPVEDEEGGHFVVVEGCGSPRRIVRKAEISSEPDQRTHSRPSSTTGAAEDMRSLSSAVAAIRRAMFPKMNAWKGRSAYQ